MGSESESEDKDWSGPRSAKTGHKNVKIRDVPHQILYLARTGIFYAVGASLFLPNQLVLEIARATSMKTQDVYLVTKKTLLQMRSTLELKYSKDKSEELIDEYLLANETKWKANKVTPWIDPRVQLGGSAKMSDGQPQSGGAEGASGAVANLALLAHQAGDELAEDDSNPAALRSGGGDSLPQAQKGFLLPPTPVSQQPQQQQVQQQLANPSNFDGFLVLATHKEAVEKAKKDGASAAVKAAASKAAADAYETKAAVSKAKSDAAAIKAAAAKATANADQDKAAAAVGTIAHLEATLVCARDAEHERARARTKVRKAQMEALAKDEAADQALLASI